LICWQALAELFASCREGGRALKTVDANWAVPTHQK